MRKYKGIVSYFFTVVAEDDEDLKEKLEQKTDMEFCDYECEEGEPIHMAYADIFNEERI